MNKTYQYLDIDVNKKIHRRLRAVQGDAKSRYILVSLYNNSMTFDLSNCSVKIFGVKSDKKIFFNYANITDTSKGQFEIELTSQALAVNGELQIQILVLGANQERLTTCTFFIDVDRTIVDDNAIQSENEFTALTKGLADLAEYDTYKNNVLKHDENLIKHENKINEVSSQLAQIEKINDLVFESGKRYLFTNHFTLNSKLTLNDLDNIVLDFSNLAIDITNIANDKIIELFNCKNVVIKNLNIINNNETSWTTIVYMENCDSCILEHSRIEGSERSVSTGYTDKYNIYALCSISRSNNCVIRHCYAKYCYAPYRLRDGSNNCIIENNNAEYCLRFGMLSGSQGFSEGDNTHIEGTRDCIVRNNRCNYIEQGFIKCEPNCIGSRIYDNQIYNCRGGDDARTGGIICFYVDTWVYNNMIISTNEDFSASGSNGVIHAYYLQEYNDSVGNNKIFNNTIKGFNSNGIHIGDGTNYNQVYNNTITDCALNGIQASTYSTGNYYNSITDNFIKDCKGIGISARYSYNTTISRNKIFSCLGDGGINCEQLRDSIVSGNYIKDCTESFGIRVSGTGYNVIIDGNIIINCAINDANKRVITFGANAYGITITNNFIKSENSLYGIYCNNLTNVICNNNRLVDCDIYFNSGTSKLSNTINYVKGNEVVS